MSNKNPKKYNKITISFTEADDDIYEYVESLKKTNKASEFIREAIREKINKNEHKRTITLNNSRDNKDLMNQLERIENKIISLEKNLKENKVHYKKDNVYNNDSNEENNESNNDSNKEVRFESLEEINIDNQIENALDFFDF